LNTRGDSLPRVFKGWSDLHFSTGCYVMVGMLVWNFFVRPEEERFLHRVFGEDYERYRLAVRCWWLRGNKYNVQPKQKPESPR